MNRTIGYIRGKRAQDSNEVFCEVQHKKTTNASIDFSESHEIGLPNSSACDENARHANVLGKAASKISEANTPKKQISNRWSRSRKSEPKFQKNTCQANQLAQSWLRSRWCTLDEWVSLSVPLYPSRYVARPNLFQNTENATAKKQNSEHIRQGLANWSDFSIQLCLFIFRNSVFCGTTCLQRLAFVQQ